MKTSKDTSHLPCLVSKEAAPPSASCKFSSTDELLGRWVVLQCEGHAGQRLSASSSGRRAQTAGVFHFSLALCTEGVPRAMQKWEFFLKTELQAKETSFQALQPPSFCLHTFCTILILFQYPPTHFLPSLGAVRTVLTSAWPHYSCCSKEAVAIFMHGSASKIAIGCMFPIPLQTRLVWSKETYWYTYLSYAHYWNQTTTHLSHLKHSTLYSSEWKTWSCWTALTAKQRNEEWSREREKRLIFTFSNTACCSCQT